MQLYLRSWTNMSSRDCYRFRCRQMITGDCAEVAYWVTPSSTQARFCLILGLNLQFIHNGKPKVFTGAITTLPAAEEYLFYVTETEIFAHDLEYPPYLTHLVHHVFIHYEYQYATKCTLLGFL